MRADDRGAAVTSASEFVDFHITVCGIEELAGHGTMGVTHVLSILDPGFPDPDAFGAFGEHERLDLRFHDVIDELPEVGQAMIQMGRGREVRAAKTDR